MYSCPSNYEQNSTNSPKRSRGVSLLGAGLSDIPYLNSNPESASNPTPTPKKKQGRFNPSRDLGEVCGVEVFASSVVVKRHKVTRRPVKFERGEITELSDKSLGRLAFLAFNTEAEFKSIITLTYPAKYSNNGVLVKADLNAFLVWYRRRFPDEKYLWFLEFQKRGAPHFHILSTVDLGSLGKLATIKRGNGQRWRTNYNTWQSLEAFWRSRGGGSTSWEVVREKDGGKRYAAKYATKAHQKRVPEAYRDVGRFWGHSREGVKPEVKARYLCNEAMLRDALKRGGWEYVPEPDVLIHRELFQAADKIDYSKLAWTGEIKGLSHEQLIWAETGFKPVLRLWDEKRDTLSIEYQCVSCGEKFGGRWFAECPECKDWHTITGFPGFA